MKHKRYVKGQSLAKNPLKFRVINKSLDGCVGSCYPGWKLIEIDPRQCPKDYLDTLIHEALHELFPRMKEDKVLHAGTSIANLLWRLGYRKD
jgi:hypothetical protein